jgi:dehydratase
MAMKSTFVFSRLPVALAGGLALVGLAVAPASAANTSLAIACQATPPIGSAQTFTLDAGVNATAPASVASGSSFTVSLAPDALTVPSSVGGYTVNSISGIKLKVPVPANATLTKETLSGGSGLGSGTPGVAVSGSTIVLTVPGPISGGSTFTFPEITLTLTAGASGKTVTTQLGGSSYSSPGLTFTASVPVLFFTANVPTACYPSAGPVLSSTTID